jgi:hypothetical protein
LRNQLLSKELLAVLCSVFWFWFLSFSFPLLFVLGSFRYRHNNWRPPFVFGSSNKPRMSTRKKRTTANSTKEASSSMNKEPNLSALLTQGEALPESNLAHKAELAKLRKEAEELARTKKRLLAIQHEAEIQKQKAEIASLKEEPRALKVKQSLSFSQPSPEYTVPSHPHFNERTEFFTQPPLHTTFSRNPFVSPFESGPSHQDVHTIHTRPWDPKSPLSQEIQITPWPQTYRPVPLPRLSGQSDPSNS